MTYGPTLQWRVRFQERIELRKPDFRVVFISLCTVAVLIVLISFSYYTSLPVSITSNQYLTLSRESVDVNRLAKSNDSQPNVVIKSNIVIKEEISDEIIEFTAKEEENLQLQFNVDVDSMENNDTESRSEEADFANFILGTKPVQEEAIDWNDTRLDILHMPTPRYDTRFQNPCWYEPLYTADPYENNSYVPFSPAAKRTLAKMKEYWEDEYIAEKEPMRLRCLPYFLIIGQPKCGTTDLFWKIAKHPDIETPPIKELHWWSRSRQGRRFSYSKIIPFNDYVDMFDRAALLIDQRLDNITAIEYSSGGNENLNTMQTVTGEASVSLLWDNAEWMKYPENRGHREPVYIVPHYIHHIIPDARLIIMLRDPVERLYSDYLYFLSNNKSADDFHSRVKFAISLYTNCTARYSVRQCVYDTDLSNKVRVRIRIGMYSVFLKDWLELFPLEQFFILRLEDYSKSTVQYVKQIYQFLGIRDITKKEEEELISPGMNARKPEDKLLGGMHEETRALLRDFYGGYNQELAKILGNTKFLWTDVQS